ncbi:hypothetical protein [Ekhidna sp.]|uniref:hypothetical protein n=1 Tax=Ekhidna sp. TaxID=2608089 RepID=UPI003BA87674
MKLSASTEERLDAIRTSYDISSTASNELLNLLGDNLEMMNQAQEEIEAYRAKHKKLTVTDRFKQEKPHPVIGIIKDTHHQILCCMKALGINEKHELQNDEVDPLDLI